LASLALEISRFAGGVVQVVQCLISKCEALSSNPSTIKKKAEILRFDETGKMRQSDFFHYLIISLELISLSLSPSDLSVVSRSSLWDLLWSFMNSRPDVVEETMIS
jgi:hypothetical protein